MFFIIFDLLCQRHRFMVNNDGNRIYEPLRRDKIGIFQTRIFQIEIFQIPAMLRLSSLRITGASALSDLCPLTGKAGTGDI
jgi:hypothetical protein